MLASGVFCQAMYILKNVQVKYAQSNEKKICTNVSNVLPIQSFFRISNKLNKKPNTPKYTKT